MDIDAIRKILIVGAGFYTYPRPAYQQPGFVEGTSET